LLGRYERYLRANRSWLLKDAPRQRFADIWGGVSFQFVYVS
jgi:hypothetical protein